MTGKRKKKLIIVLLTLVFSLGSISVGYGFWTDHLDLEGNAEVKFSVNIVDDIIVTPVSPQALKLIEDPIKDNAGSDGGSLKDRSTPQLPEIIEPEIVDPEIVDPEIVEPEIEDPEIEEPEIIEPEIEDPETVEPETEKPAAENIVVQTPEE